MPAKRDEVPGQVGLVVVAGLHGHVGQRCGRPAASREQRSWRARSAAAGRTPSATRRAGAGNARSRGADSTPSRPSAARPAPGPAMADELPRSQATSGASAGRVVGVAPGEGSSSRRSNRAVPRRQSASRSTEPAATRAPSTSSSGTTASFSCLHVAEQGERPGGGQLDLHAQLVPPTPVTLERDWLPTTKAGQSAAPGSRPPRRSTSMGSPKAEDQGDPAAGHLTAQEAGLGPLLVADVVADDGCAGRAPRRAAPCRARPARTPGG